MDPNHLQLVKNWHQNNFWSEQNWNQYKIWKGIFQHQHMLKSLFNLKAEK